MFSKQQKFWTCPYWKQGNFNVAKMMQTFFHRVENIVGKGENAGYQHFLLSPQCFQKAFSFVAAFQIVFVKVKHIMGEKGKDLVTSNNFPTVFS